MAHCHPALRIRTMQESNRQQSSLGTSLADDLPDGLAALDQRVRRRQCRESKSLDARDAELARGDPSEELCHVRIHQIRLVGEEPARRRVDAAATPSRRRRRTKGRTKDADANDRLKPWIDLEESTRSMGSNVGIDAMPFAIRSQCIGLNVDETVGMFVWKPKITRRPVCARAS